MSYSQARQYTAVGEGLAVGCLILGFDDLPSNPLEVKFAFMRAWREWSRAQDFPAVIVDLAEETIYHSIFRQSKTRVGHRVAWWEEGKSLRPTLAPERDLDQAEELLVEYHGISVQDWVTLAGLFVADLTVLH